jgi:hypothetical protein
MKVITPNQNLIEILKENISKINNQYNGVACPSWFQNIRNIGEDILNKNVNEFLQFGTIITTMFVGECEKTQNEFNDMKDNELFFGALEENTIGSPFTFQHHPNTSGNLVHNAYSLYFSYLKGYLPIEDLDFVFEFGGGYGSMCRVFRQLGYKKRYLLHDLPTFSEIQKYYLSSIGINDVDYTSDISEFSVKAKQAKGIKLYIATWSMSEIPLDLRDIIVDAVKDFNYFIIVYTGVHDDIDNGKYFRDLKIEGVKFEILDHPYCIHSRFLLGKKQ